MLKEKSFIQCYCQLKTGNPIVVTDFVSEIFCEKQNCHKSINHYNFFYFYYFSILQRYLPTLLFV